MTTSSNKDLRQNSGGDRIHIAEGLPESSDVTARNNREAGDAALQSGDLDATAAAYRAALEADPRNIQSYHNLGVVSARRDRWGDAADWFKKSITLSPDDPDLHFKLGLCLMQSGKRGEASSEFEIVLERDPDNLDVRFQLALVHAAGTSVASSGRERAVEAFGRS